MPTQDQLNERFYYNRKTGKLYHRVTSGGNRARSRAGHDRPNNNHSVVRVHDKLRLLHRVVWTMVYGPIPDGKIIDHLDGNTHNNRLENLRLATHQTNGQNCKLNKANKSGRAGVYWSTRDKKWAAEIGVNNKRIRLGDHHTKEAAIAAREAAERLYGFHPNHGNSRQGVRQEKAAHLRAA